MMVAPFALGVVTTLAAEFILIVLGYMFKRKGDGK